MAHSQCTPCETGTANILLGAGIGVSGTAGFLATGAVCPACVVFTPLLLGRGLMQRRAYKRQEKALTSPASSGE